MNGLYPIIRRIRRPLLPVDPPANPKPEVVSTENETKSTDPEKTDDTKTDAGDSNK